MNLEGADSAPAEATAPNAVEKRESSNAAVATDSADSLRDVRRTRFDNRRKKYYTNRRLYSRRRPVSHSSQSSSEGTSSSESVSDSDERTGRRSKSPASNDPEFIGTHAANMDMYLIMFFECFPQDIINTGRFREKWAVKWQQCWHRTLSMLTFQSEGKI